MAALGLSRRRRPGRSARVWGLSRRLRRCLYLVDGRLGRRASRIFGQSNSMSGLCSSIQRMASSSSAGRPTFTSGRRAEPVEHSLPRAALPAANGMDERRCFIPALVAGKPQKWQGYLRLDERVAFLAAFGRLRRLRPGA